VNRLELSLIETVKLPEVVDMVFPESIEGASGVVYTLTDERVLIAFPVGFSTLIYSEYTFPISGIWAFPVSDIVKMYFDIPAVLATLEFP
jgi:hypothetical protein